MRRDIFEFLLNSVRNPFVFASDLKARVATCKRIRDRGDRIREKVFKERGVLDIGTPAAEVPQYCGVGRKP